jgi:hypothetical protein
VKPLISRRNVVIATELDGRHLNVCAKCLIAMLVSSCGATTMETMPGFHRPSVQAFLVCDCVIEDSATRKKSLIGIFTHLRSASFPFQHQQLGVYFCLTDAEGTYQFEIDLYFLNTNQLVCRATLPHIDIGDRLQISDFGINIPIIIFPAPGRYEFRLRIGHTIIAQKDFNVIDLPAQPEEKEKL